jgi:phosphatidylinositol alpha-1,6-mannosyltransferase
MRWLLTVARLVGHKGIDTGLRVLAALGDSHPELGYLIVGTGPMQPQLQALARELGIAHRVRFLTGVPDAELPLLYNCAEVYLGLSRPEELLIEGFGISLAEASASALPVVTGRAGGMSDAVRHGLSGLLVDATSVSAATAAVQSLIENRELGRRLGQAGRRAVEEYFNWDRVAEEVRGIGEEYAGSKAGKRVSG